MYKLISIVEENWNGKENKPFLFHKYMKLLFGRPYLYWHKHERWPAYRWVEFENLRLEFENLKFFWFCFIWRVALYIF